MLVQFLELLDKLIIGMYSTIEDRCAMLFINKGLFFNKWLIMGNFTFINLKNVFKGLASRACVAKWNWDVFLLGATTGKAGWEETTKFPECLAK